MADERDERLPRPRRRLRGFVDHLRRQNVAEGRLIPRWVARVTLTGAVLLVPWSVFLVTTLPSHTTAHDWNVAWAGFDVGMAIGLAALAVAIVRRSVWAGVLAAICGTMLLVDAWFDVTTAAPGDDRATAIVMAALLEVPGSVLCFATARHIGLVLLQARRYLDAAGVHLVAGRLVDADDHVLPSGNAAVDARFAHHGGEAPGADAGGAAGSPLSDAGRRAGMPPAVPSASHAAPPTDG